MKTKLKYSLLGVLAILILIQLIPVDRTNPPIDNGAEVTAPPDVKMILENSCYDCHSNRTEWPLYSYFAPISWLVAGDVHDGREEMNFSEWKKYPAKKIDMLKEKMIEEVSEGGMPLPMYLLIHSQAKLNDAQKQTLKNWVDSDSGEAEAKPAEDSPLDLPIS